MNASTRTRPGLMTWINYVSRFAAVVVGLMLALTLVVRVLDDTGLAQMPRSLDEFSASAQSPLVFVAVAITIVLVGLRQAEKTRESSSTHT